MGGDWREGFPFAHTLPDREPDPGPGLVWRETSTHHWSGSWAGLPRGTVTRDSRTRQWIAYVRLKEPPGLSPITDVGRFSTADDAMVAADEVWAAR